MSAFPVSLSLSLSVYLSFHISFHPSFLSRISFFSLSPFISPFPIFIIFGVVFSFLFDWMFTTHFDEINFISTLWKLQIVWSHEKKVAFLSFLNKPCVEQISLLRNIKRTAATNNGMVWGVAWYSQSGLHHCLSLQVSAVQIPLRSFFVGLILCGYKTLVRVEK